LEEGFARLEGRVEELSKRIDEFRNDMIHRFVDLRDEMNNRFADLKRFFYITWGVTWGLLIAILSFLIR
jgi:predicted nuclease with TOPRIM domain